MAVLASKTEPKCKLCTHTQRAAIDALLERRSKGESDEKGRRFNEGYVIETLKGWGVVNPTKENLTIHWRKHCEVISAEEAKQVNEALSDLNKEMLTILEQSDGSIDSDLLAIFRLGTKRIRGRILRGEDPGVTLEHQLKAAAELTKRSHNESTRELLGALGAGIVRSLEQQRAAGELEAGDIIDAEIVEETAA